VHASRLCLNASKTQVLWLGSRHNIDRLTVRVVPVLSSTVGVVGSARDLGVVIDSQLSTADLVASVCRSAYYHLRQIRPTLQSLSRDAAKTLVQAFISSRLDYCNSVLYGRHHRQLTSTTAVCTERSLQVNHADYFPCSAGIALAACPTPCGLQTGNTDVQTAAHRRISQMRGSRRLRPVAVSARLAPSHASYRCPGLVWATSFDVAGPRLWNKLPASLRSSDSLCQFRRQLKMFFVCQGLGCGA